MRTSPRGSRPRLRGSASREPPCASRSASPRGSPSTARCWPSRRRRSWSCVGATTCCVSMLEAEGPGCVLHLTVTFPEHGKGARDGAGWHVCLEQLAYECDGADPPWHPPDRWRVVHRGYVERLGPEASVLGPPEEWERVQRR